MPAIRVAVRSRPIRLRTRPEDVYNDESGPSLSGRSPSPKKLAQTDAVEDRSILSFPADDSLIIDLPSRLTSPPVPQSLQTQPPSQQQLLQQQQQTTGPLGTHHQFTFDYCYAHDALPAEQQQELIFQQLGTDVIESAFNGYNGCVFAYGQTGSGKTYTMLGPRDNPGLVPRICGNIFDRLAIMASKDHNYKSHKVSVSFMEIYNERVRDLLSPESKKSQRIREHPTKGPYVDGLSKHVVHSSDSLMKWIRRGMESRAMAETQMNEQSSRSHAIIVLNLAITMFEPDLSIMNEKTSTVCLVDLAGSERSSVSQTTGDRLKEGSSINKSLTTLGLVIKALADKSRLEQQGRLEESRRIFVPYRDSILTWLLKECLGGNSKTIMLATVNPSARFAEETMSTLRYANRARNIINRIQVNEDPNIRIIKELREEIRRLKDRLAVYEGANGDAGRERVESGAVSVTSGDVARLEALLQESTKLANLSWEQRHANFTSDDGELDDDYDEPEVAAFDDDEPEVAAFDDVEPLFSAPSASRQQPQSNATPVMETNSRSQLSSSIEWSKQQDINTTTRFSLVRLPDGQQQLTPTAPISTQQLEQFEIEPGETKIGSDPLSQNIVLDGLYIESRHALLDTDPSGNLFITPVGRCSDTDGLNDILLQHCRRQSSQLQSVANKFEAAVKINSADELPWIYVNGERIMDRTQLFIGSRVMFSRSNVFQVVDAQQLRDKQQQSAIQSDDVSAVDGLPEMSRPPAADANGEGEDEDSNMLPIKTTRLLMPTPPSSAGSNRRTLFDERTLSAAGPQQPIQIPYYEQVVDDLGRSFYTFHIYLTLPSSSNSSSTCTYHVSRRFREFNAFYRQWKPYMPLLIDRSFPSQWSTLFSGSSRNAQLRRHRLELFLNSFLLWWIQKASAQYRRPVDVDLIQRKLWLFSDLNALGPSPSSSSSLAPTAVSEREPRKSLPNSKSRTETSSASSADVFSRIR